MTTSTGPELEPRPVGTHRLRQLGSVALLLALVLVLTRMFFLRLYEVSTPSMEPTIHGAVAARQGLPSFPGQSVLVGFGPLFSTSDLERFDLVVIDRGEGGLPLTKRIVGLPGERLTLTGGDLLIDGKRLPADAAHPPGVEVFDQARDPFIDAFHLLSGEGQPWQVGPDGELTLSGAAVAEGTELGMALLHRELADDVRLGNGQLELGKHQVNDGSLSFEVRVHEREASGHLRARLVEDGDIFEAELEFDRGRVHVQLLRSPGREQLAAADLVSMPATWSRLSFENRDNHLRLTLAAADQPERLTLALNADYASNRPFEANLPPGISSIAPRVAFGGDGLDASFRAVRVVRDLFWIPTGPWGSRPSIELGPDAYFLLGDNSANSLDSRYWGPVSVEMIIGRPLAVVRPWAQRRWL